MLALSADLKAFLAGVTEGRGAASERQWGPRGGRQLLCGVAGGVPGGNEVPLTQQNSSSSASSHLSPLSFSERLAGGILVGTPELGVPHHFIRDGRFDASALAEATAAAEAEVAELRGRVGATSAAAAVANGSFGGAGQQRSGSVGSTNSSGTAVSQQQQGGGGLRGVAAGGGITTNGGGLYNGPDDEASIADAMLTGKLVSDALRRREESKTGRDTTRAAARRDPAICGSGGVGGGGSGGGNNGSGGAAAAVHLRPLADPLTGLAFPPHAVSFVASAY